MRYAMSFCLMFLICFPVFSYVELVKNGMCKHKIVLNSNPSPSEKYAAEELKDHLRLCAEVEIPIIQGKPENGAPMIVIGCGDVAKGLGVDPSPDELGEQGSLIQTVVLLYRPLAITS